MDDAAPRLSLAFELEARIGPAVEFGEVGGGLKRMVPILGGRVSGRLEAEVIPGGADWQVIRPTGVTDLWARYALRTADGAAVVVTNTGVRRASAEVSARLAGGERVDPAEYYFRCAPAFETGSPAHRWLTETLFVGVGERWPDCVRLKVFEVL
ncbi:MAG TPA: DUF3237 domain-containing protein [Caulobacteraceae bacterium]|jgi:hypothetical protein